VDSLWVKGRNPEKGALNRYYGVMTNGKLKVRGIETRRSDTPKLISKMQDAMLGKLAEARSASEFYVKIPEALSVLREYTRKVLDKECELSDMIFKTHVSKACDEYRQFNNQMAAMKQMREEGIETQPGQTIRYIITDHKSRSYQDGIIKGKMQKSLCGY
jgi:DNA polymerase I